MSLVKRQKVEEENHDDTSYEALVFEGHEGPVITAKFSGDGKFVASGGLDRQILLWVLPNEAIETETEASIGSISGHKNGITSLMWSSDDSHLYSSSADSTLALWDLETGKKLLKFQGHKSIVNQLDLDSQMASVGDDGKCLIWDPRSKHPVASIETNYPLTSVVVTDNRVYFSGIDPTIHAYDLRDTEKSLWEETVHKDTVTSLSLNESTLFSSSQDGTLRSYDAQSFVAQGISRVKPEIYADLDAGTENFLLRSTVNRAGDRLFCGSADKTVTVWDVHSARIVSKLASQSGTIIDVDLHPTENILLSTSVDGTILIREY
ncbi:hypothetical protein LJB42_000136 [Komagataella kurtzmanii]|nr:hypothetical protein LJB42_000136 [Komagataella kurtzmanii]